VEPVVQHVQQGQHFSFPLVLTAKGNAMKRIVIGVDGSPGGQNALRWAGSLASVHDAELVVMTGFVPGDSEMRPGRYEQLVAEQQENLDTWSEAAEVGGVSIRTVVERGDPRPGIMNVAEREEADLIVVGREGRSAGPGLLHIGSMAEWVAHHAERPVAIVGGAVNVETHSAIVGVDGSGGSFGALTWVAELASHSTMRIVAAAVDRHGAEWSPADSPVNWRRDAEARIRAQWDEVPLDVDADFTILTLHGFNPADSLLQAARHERTDIIVVGTRGLGGFSALRIGGVALKVLHRADRPVVIVPPTTNSE
jgi:nucleotide-binding universal stress UspA family protein